MSQPVILSTDGLQNLWAVDTSGRLVFASSCAKGQRYRCINNECNAELVVRSESSDGKRAHLTHVGDSCSPGESLTHQAAKTIVAQRLGDWLAGTAPPPYVGHECACGRILDSGLAPADAVVVEGACGSRRADVLLTLAGSPSLAIELLVAHAVDEDKAAELAAMKLFWCELDAERLMRGGYWVWRRGVLPHSRCPCHSNRAIDRRWQEATAEQERSLSLARRNAAEEIAAAQRAVDAAVAKRRAQEDSLRRLQAEIGRYRAELGRPSADGSRYGFPDLVTALRAGYGRMAPEQRDYWRCVEAAQKAP